MRVTAFIFNFNSFITMLFLTSMKILLITERDKRKGNLQICHSEMKEKSALTKIKRLKHYEDSETCRSHLCVTMSFSTIF